MSVPDQAVARQTVSGCSQIRFARERVGCRGRSGRRWVGDYCPTPRNGLIGRYNCAGPGRVLSAVWCFGTTKNGRGAGGVAGGTGNDAFFGVAGKGGAGSLRPLGWHQFSMSKIAVLTLVPWLAKVPAGRSSYHPPEFSARGFKVDCCRGPFAQMATKRPPGFSIFIAC